MGILRLLLAVAVIVHHTVGRQGAYTIDGPEAVRIFFIISGFYMAMILTGKYGNTRSGITGFFLNRALRLYPTYYAALLGTIAWQLFSLWSTHRAQHASPLAILHEAGAAFAAKWIWLPNYTLTGLDVSYCYGTWPGWPPLPSKAWIEGIWIPQMWSVSVEMWFYLMAPRLAFGPAWRIVAAGLISLVLQLSLRDYSNFAYSSGPASSTSSPWACSPTGATSASSPGWPCSKKACAPRDWPWAGLSGSPSCP